MTQTFLAHDCLLIHEGIHTDVLRDIWQLVHMVLLEIDINGSLKKKKPSSTGTHIPKMAKINT